MSFEVGQRVGDRYLLEDEIGKGGMARVFRAKDIRTGRVVAVKQIDVASHPESIDLVKAWFSRELKALALLDHANVVRLVDVSEPDALEPWIVTEFLDGCDLQHVVDTHGKLPEKVVAHIAVEALSALDAAHALGIAHRDIKPANLFLCANARVVLIDFGVARGTQADVSKTLAKGLGTTVQGTPYYLSPEQIAGVTVSLKSDLYSLGVTLQYLLTGELPFSGNLFEVLKKIALGEAAPITTPGLNPSFKQFILSLRAMQEAQRPESAAAAKKTAQAIARQLGGASDAHADFTESVFAKNTATVQVPTIAGATSMSTPHDLAPADTQPSGIGAVTAVTAVTQVNAATPPAPVTQVIEVDGVTQIATVNATTPVTAPGARGGARSLVGVAIVAGVLVIGAVATAALMLKPKPPPPPSVANVEPPAPPQQATETLPEPAAAEVPPALPTEPEPAPAPAPTPAPVKKKAPGTVSLKLRQWANVSVDGNDIGRRQISASLELEPGRHVLVFRNPKFGERSHPVTIKSGESISLEVDFSEH